MPRNAELATDLLVSEPWIIEHRAQPDECSTAVEAVMSYCYEAKDCPASGLADGRLAGL